VLHLVRALTRLEHLAGFADGIGLLNGLLERYWAGLHPQLDAEDNNDPTLRLNALAPLEPLKGAGATETLLRDLREAAVVPPTPQFRVALRDLLILDGKLSGATGGQGGAEVDAALRAAIDKDPAVVDLPGQAIAAVQRLRSIVAEHVGSELAPDISAIVEMLKPAAQRLARLAGRAEAAGAAGEAPATSAGPRLAGDIRSRDDIVRAIDAICAYLERTEPANPAPLLLRRAQRLLNMNFVELIADLAPDSVGQVRQIAGLKDEYQ
jgi:type VI secretion system protein ImpA